MNNKNIIDTLEKYHPPTYYMCNWPLIFNCCSNRRSHITYPWFSDSSESHRFTFEPDFSKLEHRQLCPLPVHGIGVCRSVSFINLEFYEEEEDPGLALTRVNYTRRCTFTSNIELVSRNDQLEWAKMQIRSG